MTSPNFGVGVYPNDLDYKQTIKVEKGKAIKIHFTDWEVELWLGRRCDDVTITEGDGSTLANIRSEEHDFGVKDIPEFVSKTDTVHVLFRTDESVGESGWRLIWGEYIHI